MKKIILIAVMATAVMTLNAQSPTVIKLWPDGVPEDNGLTEVAHQGTYVNVTDPEIQLYIPEKGNTTGQVIVICPGGSYRGLAFQHEGVQVAEWLNEQGITAVILKYRMPEGHFEIPRKDVQKAIELTRENAAKWGARPDKVGIMGFSAGGHLASTAATHFTSAKNRPDFAILIYPVITMDDRLTHLESRKNLIGAELAPERKAEFSNELRVTSDTPPTFIAFSDDDSGVDPRNGTMFYNAMKAKKVPGEIHIYPGGEHGWGWKKDFKYRDEFLTSLSRWLDEINQNK